ncbi:hypothetical protein KY363_05615 [Candidatus Woesearchaeota archaeon]|nr:hypothetical protein [Candidatus Woesearchaeota archaeon]
MNTQPQAPNFEQQLIGYIEDQLKQGYRLEQIKNYLLESGYPESSVESATNHVAKGEQATSSEKTIPGTAEPYKGRSLTKPLIGISAIVVLFLILLYVAGTGKDEAPDVQDNITSQCVSGDRVCPPECENSNDLDCPPGPLPNMTKPDIPPAPPNRTEVNKKNTSYFKFIRTIKITPDDNLQTGAFVRINYIPATDRFAVTFGGEIAKPSGGCMGKAFAYKEYTTDMEELSKPKVFACDVADASSIMINNTYYFAAMGRRNQSIGWHMLKINATTWEPQIDMFYALDEHPKEADWDMMIAFVNGQIDISSQYNPTGEPPSDMTAGAATHHNFFSTDLQLIDKMILNDTQHIMGSSLLFVNNTYQFITASGFMGDLILMQYDQNWSYLGMKKLIPQAHWSTGAIFDGQNFYIAYIDTHQRTIPGFLPVWLNVHLAAFDSDWNLLEDIPVTNYTPSDNKQLGRPWLMLHENKLYVSYDLDTSDPVTHEEHLKWQAYISIYELNTTQPLQ